MSEKFLLPNGDVTAAADEDGRQSLLAAGATPVTDAEVHVNELKKQYSAWYYAPEAFALKAAQGALPGATSAVLGGLDLLDEGAGQTSAEFIKGVTEAHPMAGTLGMLSGIAVTAGAGQATYKAVAGVGAALGAGVASDSATIDNLALAHVQTPEGGEKVFAQIGLSALLGAGLASGAKAATGWLVGGGVAKVGEAIEDKGAQVLANRTIPKPAQEQLAASGVLDEAKDYLVQNKVITKSPSEIKAFLRDRARVTDAVIKEARTATATDRLDMQTQLQFAQAMRQQLAGTPPLKAAMKAFDEPWNLEQLHNLRMNIDKSVNWAEPSSQYSQKLMAARETVDKQISDLFAGWASNPATAEQATRWQAANAEFSTIMNLSGALKTRGSGGAGLLSALAGGMNKTGNYMLGGAMFGSGPGAIAGMGMKAAAAGVRGVERGAHGTALVGIGKALQGFDESVVQTVASGLAGKGGVAPKAAATLANYNELLSLVNLSAMKPTEVIPRMAQNLEQQGIPGAVVDAAVPQGLKTIQYLASQAPQNPFHGQTVAPTQWHAPAKDKADFLDKVNAVNNPLWALANPTPARIGALRAAYPNMMAKVQNMVISHASSQPDMPLSARRWAAHITGLAASPLAIPRLGSALAFGDQQLAAARQQQMSRPSQGGGGSSMIQPSRLDRMTSE